MSMSRLEELDDYVNTGRLRDAVAGHLSKGAEQLLVYIVLRYCRERKPGGITVSWKDVLGDAAEALRNSARELRWGGLELAADDAERAACKVEALLRQSENQ